MSELNNEIPANEKALNEVEELKTTNRELKSFAEETLGSLGNVLKKVRENIGNIGNKDVSAEEQLRRLQAQTDRDLGETEQEFAELMGSTSETEQVENHGGQVGSILARAKKLREKLKKEGDAYDQEAANIDPDGAIAKLFEEETST